MNSVIITRTNGIEYKLTFDIVQKQTPRTIGRYIITEENLKTGNFESSIISSEWLAYETFNGLKTADCVVNVRKA
jgi:hypothetical protein